MSQRSSPASDLLNEVSKIVGEIDVSGRKFNIFNILERNEYEDAHSNMLAALLNPEGKHPHGQGDAFLKEFLGIRKINFDLSDITVEREVPFPDGRLDIVITDRRNNREIFIENKIHAAEQENQLGRYYRHNPEAEIIFLTLDGREPRKIRTKDKPLLKSGRLHCMSYRRDIDRWLNKCEKYASATPSLREAIIQYHAVVKKNVIMDKILKSVFRNKETYFAYRELLNVQESIIDQIGQQAGEAAKELGFMDSSIKRQNYFILRHPTLEKHKLGIFIDNISISDSGPECEYNFGFFTDTKCRNQVRQNIQEAFKKKWKKAAVGREELYGVMCIVWMSDKAQISDIIDGSFEVKMSPMLQKMLKMAEVAMGPKAARAQS